MLDLTCFWNITCSSMFNNYPFCKAPHIFRNQPNRLTDLNHLKHLNSKTVRTCCIINTICIFLIILNPAYLNLNHFDFCVNSQARYFYLRNTFKNSNTSVAGNFCTQQYETIFLNDIVTLSVQQKFTVLVHLTVLQHVFPWAAECTHWLPSFPHSLTGLIHASLLCLD